ncbi:alpha/beta fold hydrolase [Pseudomonas sp. UL073]|uniref:Alpha/beta fold hydrolase n=1 Tax=Zestomonas insulae TaxID=2809017 RepID=A0ABS2I8H4_9GAMM|nr:alpha/beta fold hydrolase [Pseudomonas insulae]MBM7059247.1 alpha/beta fold hydrolase [Pseudomonas insulae]
MSEAVPFAGGRCQCPYTTYSAGSGAPVLLILPALGVAARKYEALAQSLVQAGLNVLVADWPGQGESRPRPSRQFDYGYRQLVEDFVPQLRGAAERHFPGSLQVLVGHSLGGQVATLYAAAHPNSGVTVIGVACGNIHYRHWQGLRRLMTPTVAVIFNLLTAVLGYLPGKRIGFGGHEARQLMRDWGRVAWTGSFRHTGLAQSRSADNPTRSLYIAIDGDTFAPPASTRGLAEMIQAPPQIDLLPSPRPPQENPHSAWLKAPHSVVERIASWLAQQPAQVERRA